MGALNRLTDSTGSYGEIDYGYDLVGNRLTQNTTSKLINYLYYPSSNKLWSYNDPAKGGNENNIKQQYKRLIESWEHLIENSEDRRCFKQTKDTDDEFSVIARDEVSKQSPDPTFRHSRENGNPEDDDYGNHRTKTCFTYATLVNAMLGIASEKNVDLQTFIGLLIPSDEIKTDVTDIINRVNTRGVNATLEKEDIKLFKQLFEDMEEVFDHLKGLNPGDPTLLYDAAGYISCMAAWLSSTTDLLVQRVLCH